MSGNEWNVNDPEFSFTDALHSDGFEFPLQQQQQQPIAGRVLPGAVGYDSDRDAEGEIDEEFGFVEEFSEYEDDEEYEEEAEDDDDDEWASNDDEILDDSDADGGQSDVDDDGVYAEGGAVLGSQIDSFHRTLQTGSGFGRLGKAARKGRAKKGRRAAQDIAPSVEVQILLGQANQHYAAGEWQETLKLVQRVIQIEPKMYPAWKVMGEVYLSLNEPQKCLLSWISAAHTRPRESELWVTCARMTLDLEPEEGVHEDSLKEQAIYLYSQAIKANPKDWTSIFERGNLLQELQKFGRAALDFRKLLDKILPHDTSVVKSLTQCLIGMGKVEEAINTFESHIAYWNTWRGREGGLDWKHVNMLGDLCALGKCWLHGIKQIKTLSRLLLARGQETFWDDVRNDCEWDYDDERRNQVAGFVRGARSGQSSYNLPPELRFKLGQFRVKLGQFEEGMRHFEILRKGNILNIGDLLLAAGDACAEANKHDEAVDLWFPLTEIDLFQTVDLWLRLGKSYKSLRSWENARKCLECVVECKPDELEARLLLIEIYDVLDLNEKALELVNEVIDIRARSREEGLTSGGSGGQEGDGRGFFISKDGKKKPKSRKYNPSANERYQAEKQRTELCLQNYQKLELLRPKVEHQDTDAILQWLDTAGEMFDDFRSSRALYPSERRFEYAGFLGYTTVRRKGKRNLENQMNLMKRRLESNLEYQLELESKEDDQPQPDITQYRGLGFDVWLNIILNYAVLLTTHEDGGEAEAYEVCKAAKDANVFYHDKKDPDPTKRPRFLISLVHLACAIYAQDPDQTSEVLRYFTSTLLFHDNSYHLYATAASFVRGNLKTYPGTNLFSVQNNQKYLMRQLKALDKHVLDKNVGGVSSALLRDDQDVEIVPEMLSINALVLYAQIMLDGRSYTSSLHYLSRAYAVQENHPMIVFQIALAYLHRAMQRQSENRQYHILQGLVFLHRYYKLKSASADWFDRQEAEYNLGRAYHQVGLEHYAVGYYDKVVKMSEEWVNPGVDEETQAEEELKFESGDLKWEAAYNLQLLYHTVGSGDVAREAAKRALVV
ncbi:hypothetical protein DRE_04046 [Drechslerella stenobrocha 248]|uniref:TPR-like protein n=1 Tax=Drechslerella stenobrocha 248 TaxID=1043628 RepID=W7HRV9_9PEZI|nr:hypothetical protein DRE_04046 [Drechslerella stenobrocha 248]